MLARGKCAVMYGRHPGTGDSYYYASGLELRDIRPIDIPRVGARDLARLGLELPGGSQGGAANQAAGAITSGPMGMTLQEAIRGVSQGRRHRAILCVASAYRGFGRPLDDAFRAAFGASKRCAPPYPKKDARDVVRWVYANLPAGRRRGMPDGVPPIVAVAVDHVRTNLGLEGYSAFLAMCGDMQRHVGDDPIALPQIAVSKAFDRCQKTVSNWIRRGLDEGFLEPVCSRYEVGRRAKTFRCVGPRG